jgi:iron complex transport system substrate-binding protein
VPNRRRIAAALFAALAALSLSCGARTLTDETGAKVEVPERVSRVAVTNIYPLASALTVYLGDGRAVAGMAPASYAAAEHGLLGRLYPDVLKADRSYMRGASLSVEALAALKPDLVLVNARDRRMAEAVRRAGLPAYGISAVSHGYDVMDTLEAWMKDFAEIWPEKAERSKAIIARARGVEKAVAARTASVPAEKRVRVLYIVRAENGRIVTSGKRFFGEYWCRAAGAVNAASYLDAENMNAVLTAEDVYAADPDVIFITNFTPAQPADLSKAGFAGGDLRNLRAVKAKRVYKMPLGIYRSFTPSADAPLTLLWTAKTLYTERFEDIDLRAEAKRWYAEMYGAELSDEEAAKIFSPSSEAGKMSAKVLSGE